MSMRARCLILLTTAAVAACRSAPGPSFIGASLLTPSSDAEVAHDELLRADVVRADSVARSGFATGLASNFAPDVIYLRGGLPTVRGIEIVRSILSAETLANNSTVRWQPVRAEASSDGKSGYSYGYTVYSTPATGSAALRIDRYIAYWRKEPAGWKIAAYAETYGSTPPALMRAVDLGSSMLADVDMSRRTGPLDEVRSADVDFSRDAGRRGTGEAFGLYAAENAQIFSGPGDLTTGPQAIAQSFGPRDEKSSLAWRPVEGEVAASGDLGFTVGNAVFTGEREDGAAVIRYTKYLTVWKKQRDGRWRYVVDGGSARPAR